MYSVCKKCCEEYRNEINLVVNLNDGECKRDGHETQTGKIPRPEDRSRKLSECNSGAVQK